MHNNVVRVRCTLEDLDQLSKHVADEAKKTKNEPVIKIGNENIVGVELLVDIPNKTIQFYSITSSVKGYGEKIVSSVVNSAPKDWKIVVVMDWSMGFWQVMAERYPRLVVF